MRADGNGFHSHEKRAYNTTLPQWSDEACFKASYFTYIAAIWVSIFILSFLYL